MKRYHEEGPQEETLYAHGGRCAWNSSPTNDERDEAIGLLCERLGVEIYRTNKTKHGDVEVKLREIES